MRQVYKKGTFLYLFLIIKFSNAKLQNILTCLVMDEWRRKMWHIYPVEYYSPIEKNGILCFIANWMKLEAHCIDWNKSDIGDHQHVFPFICGCWRELVWTYSNFRVAMEGERKGKNDWTICTKMQVNVIGGRGWGVSSVGTVYTSMTIWVEIPQHPCKKHSMAAHASAGTILGAHWGASLIGSLKLPAGERWTDAIYSYIFSTAYFILQEPVFYRFPSKGQSSPCSSKASTFVSTLRSGHGYPWKMTVHMY